MLKHLFYAAICVPLGLFSAKAGAQEAAASNSAHDFSFIAITGEALPLSQFKGKPILVVNTASECGFTPQYKELQALWERYKEQGLVVVAVPSNDFGGQEPGTDAQIKAFCQTHYGVDFVLTSKEHVKGEQAHPFYAWAREQKGTLAAPKWNFHKYLIAPDGSLDEWFASTTTPLSPKITARIDQLLRKNQSDEVQS